MALDLENMALKVLVYLDGLNEASDRINNFMMNMRQASTSVAAVISKDYEKQLQAAKSAYSESMEAAAKARDTEMAVGAAAAGTQEEVAAAIFMANRAYAERAQAAEAAYIQETANAEDIISSYDTIASAASTAYQTITAAIGESLTELNRYAQAMNGMDAAAQRQGISSAQTVQTLNGVTDSILGATDASTVLGHLFNSGFGADKAAAVLNRFKESAALSRTENVGFTASLVAAAQALENGDSSGLKSIGIMKSQADMWKDYADSVGLAVDQLSDTMKVEAVYRGIRAIQGTVPCIRIKLFGQSPGFRQLGGLFGTGKHAWPLADARQY